MRLCGLFFSSLLASGFRDALEKAAWNFELCSSKGEATTIRLTKISIQKVLRFRYGSTCILKSLPRNDHDEINWRVKTSISKFQCSSHYSLGSITFSDTMNRMLQTPKKVLIRAMDIVKCGLNGRYRPFSRA